jgi:hypothetical protein
MCCKLGEEIKDLRQKLYTMIEDHEVSTEDVLKCSQDLDRLIFKFVETVKR